MLGLALRYLQPGTHTYLPESKPLRPKCKLLKHQVGMLHEQYITGQDEKKKEANIFIINYASDKELDAFLMGSHLKRCAELERNNWKPA